MISLIIPTFNRCKDLQETLDSILAQEHSGYEVLVIDNGPSTDSTAKVMSNYIENKRIKYYRTHLKGVTYARSLGNLLAKGEIIIQMDDDVTLIDSKTLGKIESLFANSQADILGVMELKTKDQINKFLLSNADGIPKNITKVDLLLKNIGNIDSLYNLSTGFEMLLGQLKALYRIESFRSCFMAYSREVILKLNNWDVNYVKVGSKGLIREETDFLLRANRAGFDIRYTNYSAILHRAGQRDETLAKRGKGLKHCFFYASAHSYMVTKDIIEHRWYKKFLYWIPYQIFIGASKNPGILTLMKKHSLLAIPVSVSGFFFGLIYALLVPRRFILHAEKHLIN